VNPKRFIHAAEHSMTSPPSLSYLQSSDRLMSSPQLTPSLKPFQSSPSFPQSYPCSVPSCTHTTTSSPLPLPFLPLAVLCFPSSHPTKSFTDKSSSYLCRDHRTRLEEYRRLAEGHAAHSMTVWNDMQGEHGVEEEVEEVSEVRPLTTATTHSAFTAANYATFPSVSPSYTMMNGEEGVKPSLGVAARVMLAGGWLVAASFVSLWAGYTALNLVHNWG
jgi:hypothetical protein